MQPLPEGSPLLLKTLELCTTLVATPEFQSVVKRLETFEANESARALLNTLNEKGAELQQKQQLGLPLAEAEIGEFESARQTFFANPLGQDFVQAQEQMQKMQQAIGKYVGKAFETGRVPVADDFAGDCSDGTCGCH